jgi:hypothetical protein
MGDETMSNATEHSHVEERTSGIYTGPKGRFFRIVDPRHPARYCGWGSTREACERFARSPDLPDGVVVESAPQLTSYEARYSDLAGGPEPMPFAAWRKQQEYLIANKVPTIHEAE